LNSLSKSQVVKTSWPFLNVIGEKAVEMLGPCKVGLFGSRATGSFRENSDFDIAVSHGGTPEKWAAFVDFVKESPVTLFDIDLVDMGQADPHILEAISRDWISLHDS
jgi:predicted nucleotidyltransferase